MTSTITNNQLVEVFSQTLSPDSAARKQGKCKKKDEEHIITYSSHTT